MSFETQKLPIDRDVLAKQLETEAESRFDIEEVKMNEEIYRLLSEIQDISEKRYPVEKSAELVIENDFDDENFDNLAQDIQSSFSPDFLDKAGISRITIRPDIVHLAIGKGLYLSKEEYEAWRQENPKIDQFKVRAENFTTFETDGWIKDNYDIDERLPLPIVVYAFTETEHENIEHLTSVAPDTRERLYKFGTVTHEIGHHAFRFVITPEQKEAFRLLIKESTPLTEYAKLYRDKDVYAEEQFCEAVRLLTTNPTHLQETAPDIYTWFQNELPDIHPLRDIA